MVSEFIIRHTELKPSQAPSRWLVTTTKEIFEVWSDGAVVYCRQLT